MPGPQGREVDQLRCHCLSRCTVTIVDIAPVVSTVTPVQYWCSAARRSEPTLERAPDWPRPNSLHVAEVLPQPTTPLTATMPRALRSRTPRPVASSTLIDPSLDSVRCSSAPLPDSATASPLITQGRLRSDAARFQKQKAHALTSSLPTGADCSINILHSAPIRFATSARNGSEQAFSLSKALVATSAERSGIDSSLLYSLETSSRPASFTSSLASELLHHCRTCNELVPVDSDGIAMCTDPKLRNFLSFMMLSHIPFAIATFLAFANAHTMKGLVYSASLVASLLYHRSREHQFCRIDVILACALIATNCVRLWEEWMWIPVSTSIDTAERFRIHC